MTKHTINPDLKPGDPNQLETKDQAADFKVESESKEKETKEFKERHDAELSLIGNSIATEGEQAYREIVAASDLSPSEVTAVDAEVGASLELADIKKEIETEIERAQQEIKMAQETEVRQELLERGERLKRFIETYWQGSDIDFDEIGATLEEKDQARADFGAAIETLQKHPNLYIEAAPFFVHRRLKEEVLGELLESVASQDKDQATNNFEQMLSASDLPDDEEVFLRYQLQKEIVKHGYKEQAEKITQVLEQDIPQALELLNQMKRDYKNEDMEMRIEARVIKDRIDQVCGERVANELRKQFEGGWEPALAFCRTLPDAAPGQTDEMLKNTAYREANGLGLQGLDRIHFVKDKFKNAPDILLKISYGSSDFFSSDEERVQLIKQVAELGDRSSVIEQYNLSFVGKEHRAEIAPVLFDAYRATSSDKLFLQLAEFRSQYESLTDQERVEITRAYIERNSIASLLEKTSGAVGLHTGQLETIMKAIPREYKFEFTPTVTESLLGHGADARKVAELAMKVDPIQVMQQPELSRQLLVIKQEQGGLPEQFVTKLQDELRYKDPLLSYLNISELNKNNAEFYNAILAITAKLEGIGDDTENAAALQDLLGNREALFFIGRQPEKVQEVLQLPDQVPTLFGLLEGPLASNRANILTNIFSNGSALKRAKEIETIFTKSISYWKQLSLFTEARIGDKLSAADSAYPIDKIGAVSIVDIIKRHKKEKQANPNRVTRLESMVATQQYIDQLVDGSQTTLPFSQLTGMYKRVVFRDYLRSTIETSRSEGARRLADERNREKALRPLELRPGDYIHGSAIDHIDSVFLSGNLPNEALGENAAIDSYPFHVDFSRIQEGASPDKQTTKAKVMDSLSSHHGYGTGGALGEKGKLFYVYDRHDTSWEPGKEYGPSQKHALLFGGTPSTEIAGVILQYPDDTLARAKKAVLENGVYIPLYDMDGEVLFTPEEYDASRIDYNLSVPVETWDFSLKTGDQKGSNPGGEFTVPSETGPRRYYVKYASAENSDHVWSEQLSDNLYRELGVPVADTKVVKIEGGYAHASEILPLDNVNNREGLKHGFIADAWLSNWDASYNPENTASVNSQTYRLDNGGSLLFHAKGKRKEESIFNGEVKELRIGTNRERLGEGMRQEYAGLTEADIVAQVDVLERIMTDEVIDQKVDEVRLQAADRDYLKRVLKERRDYIVEFAKQYK